MWKNTKRLSKLFLPAILAFGFLVLTPTNVEARRGKDIWWATVIDFDNKQLQSTIVDDTGGSAIERKYNPDKGLSSMGVLDPHAAVKGKFEKYRCGAVETNADNSDSCSTGSSNFKMSWPGSPDTESVTDEERTYVTHISNSLTTSFNSAIGEVMRLEEGAGTLEQTRNMFADIAMCGINKGNYSPQYISSKTCKRFKAINQVDGDEVYEILKNDIIPSDRYSDYLTADDFAYFDTGDDRPLIIRVRAQRGYHEGQALRSVHPEINKYINEGRLNEFVGWNDMILQANFSSLEKGLSASNIHEITNEDDNILTKGISAIVTSIYDTTIKILGLFDYNELIFNSGTRSATYYKGIVPYGWFSSASFLYWVCQVIVVFMMAYSILLMFIKRGAAVLNPAIRTSLKDQAFNFALSIFFMVSFLFIFWAMAELNETIVSLLSSIPPSGVRLEVLMSNVSIWTIPIAFVGLYLAIRMNVFYLIRGVTVLILYTLAPIFIALPTFGGRGKELFTEWFKELVVNIFMQTFHAVILCIFLVSISKGPSRGMEKMILMYSFIPITELFKNKFLGQSITDLAGNKVTAQTKSAVMSAANTAKNLAIDGAKGAVDLGKAMSEAGGGSDGGGEAVKNASFEGPNEDKTGGLKGFLNDKRVKTAGAAVGSIFKDAGKGAMELGNIGMEEMPHYGGPSYRGIEDEKPVETKKEEPPKKEEKPPKKKKDDSRKKPKKEKPTYDEKITVGENPDDWFFPVGNPNGPDPFGGGSFNNNGPFGGIDGGSFFEMGNSIGSSTSNKHIGLNETDNTKNYYDQLNENTSLSNPGPDYSGGFMDDGSNTPIE